MPSGPSLRNAVSRPSASSCRACASGSPSPTTSATSSRLPTATVARASASSCQRRASASESQNMGRQSRSCTVCGCRAARVEGGQRRRAARLLAESRTGRPEDAGLPHGVEIDLVGDDVQVGGLGLAIEDEREPVRRIQLAEDDRREERGMRAHVAVVDAERGERGVDVRAEALGADLGDDRRATAVPGGRNGHVRRPAAQEAVEGADLGEGNPAVRGVEVDGHPADRQHVEGRSGASDACHAATSPRRKPMLSRTLASGRPGSSPSSSTRSCSRTCHPS